MSNRQCAAPSCQHYSNQRYCSLHRRTQQWDAPEGQTGRCMECERLQERLAAAEKARDWWKTDPDFWVEWKTEDGTPTGDPTVAIKATIARLRLQVEDKSRVQQMLRRNLGLLRRYRDQTTRLAVAEKERDEAKRLRDECEDEFVCPECCSFDVSEISYRDDAGSMKCHSCGYSGEPGEDFPTKTRLQAERDVLRTRLAEAEKERDEANTVCRELYEEATSFRARLSQAHRDALRFAKTVLTSAGLWTDYCEVNIDGVLDAYDALTPAQDQDAPITVEEATERDGWKARVDLLEAENERLGTLLRDIYRDAWHSIGAESGGVRFIHGLAKKHVTDDALTPAQDSSATARPQPGDYVLATKYSDGDPCDQFAVGWVSSEFDDMRTIVVDEDGVPFRASGFRRVERITTEEGRRLVGLSDEISDIPGPSLWDHLASIRAGGLDTRRTFTSSERPVIRNWTLEIEKITADELPGFLRELARHCEMGPLDNGARGSCGGIRFRIHTDNSNARMIFLQSLRAPVIDTDIQGE